MGPVAGQGASPRWQTAARRARTSRRETRRSRSLRRQAACPASERGDDGGDGAAHGGDEQAPEEDRSPNVSTSSARMPVPGEAAPRLTPGAVPILVAGRPAEAAAPVPASPGSGDSSGSASPRSPSRTSAAPRLDQDRGRCSQCRRTVPGCPDRISDREQREERGGFASRTRLPAAGPVVDRDPVRVDGDDEAADFDDRRGRADAAVARVARSLRTAGIAVPWAMRRQSALPTRSGPRTLAAPPRCVAGRRRAGGGCAGSRLDRSTREVGPPARGDDEALVGGVRCRNPRDPRHGDQRALRHRIGGDPGPRKPRDRDGSGPRVEFRAPAVADPLPRVTVPVTRTSRQAELRDGRRAGLGRQVPAHVPTTVTTVAAEVAVRRTPVPRLPLTSIRVPGSGARRRAAEGPRRPPSRPGSRSGGRSSRGESPGRDDPGNRGIARPRGGLLRSSSW